MSPRRLMPALVGLASALLIVVGPAWSEPATADAAAPPSGESSPTTSTDPSDPSDRESGDLAPPSRIECPQGAGLASGKPDPALFRDEADVRIRATWCERYDARGRSTRNGPYLDRYPSGATRTRARYVDGEIQGPIRMWHEDGSPWLAATYVDGELDGPYLMTQPNGHPWYEASYRRGVLEGPVRTWYPNGTLSAETPHEAGIEEGIARTYYSNGAPMTEIEIHGGVWSGVFKRWHPSGKLAIEGRYKPCEPGRKLPRSCSLLGAMRDGEWKEWSSPGRLIAHDVYRGGERVGATSAPVAAPAPATAGEPASALAAPTGGIAPPVSTTVDAPDPRGSLGR